MSYPSNRITSICVACGVSTSAPASRGVRLYCSNACRRSPAAAIYRLHRKTEVDPASGCWNWIGGIDINGYGVVSSSGRSVGAHRLAYELLASPVPDGKELDHLCRNRRCVNPEHLEPVTPQENVLRGTQPSVLRRRQKLATGMCSRGHVMPDPTKLCRECANALRRERRARARSEARS
jgi:hypothetical protein